MPGASAFYMIISKFSYWQDPSLVILLIINKNTKISFYNTVLSFDLAISLRIKSHKESLLNFQEKIK